MRRDALSKWGRELGLALRTYEPSGLVEPLDRCGIAHARNTGPLVRFSGSAFQREHMAEQRDAPGVPFTPQALRCGSAIGRVHNDSHESVPVAGPSFGRSSERPATT